MPSTSSRFSRFSLGKKGKPKIDKVLLGCILLIIGLVLAYVLYIVLADVIDHYGRKKRVQECTFTIVPIGTNGGLTEENLTSFFLTTNNSNHFISFDAGSLLYGIRQMLINMDSSSFIPRFNFPSWAVNDIQQAGYVLRNHVLAYFIGHSHLDHIAGLVQSSPIDVRTRYHATNPDTTSVLPKSIVGLNKTLEAIKTNIFNDIIWPDLPKFGRYSYYNIMDRGLQEIHIPVLLSPEDGEGAAIRVFERVYVRAFQLCHENVVSTAFLVSIKDPNTSQPISQLLYFSDTGVPSFVPDAACDWDGRMMDIWNSTYLDLAALQNGGAIVIETSFPDDTPDQSMFGHLRPKDLVRELVALRNLRNAGNTFKSLKVIVAHTKPSPEQLPATFDKSDSFTSGTTAMQTLIHQQLLADSEAAGLGQDSVEFIMPEQGVGICLAPHQDKRE